MMAHFKWYLVPSPSLSKRTVRVGPTLANFLDPCMAGIHKEYKGCKGKHRPNIRLLAPLDMSEWVFNPLYTNEFSLLVRYNKLWIVHCTYLGVSHYDLKINIVFFCLKIFF